MNPLSIQASPSVMFKSLLKYEALQTVSGSAITYVNYCKAVALLHERYGQKHRIVQTYMQALLHLPEKCLLKELNVMEAENSINSNAESLRKTATFFTKTKPYHKTKQPSKLQYKPSGNDLLPPKKVCAFFKAPHNSAECTTITDYTERINIVKRNQLCFNCLGRHRIADCKS